MGIDPGGVALTAPGPDHVGPPKLSIRMVAALQGFYGDWPFQGSKVPQFKQIVNAFPPIVALHLGCAVASALTGKHQDYNREVRRLATSLRLKPWRGHPPGSSPSPSVAARANLTAPDIVPDIRHLAALECALLDDEASLIKTVDYPPYEGADREESEAEHYVEYWLALEAERAALAGAADCVAGDTALS